MSYPDLVDAVAPQNVVITSALPTDYTPGQRFVITPSDLTEVNAAGDVTAVPLGQSGPFVVETPSGEHILCATISPQGLAIVYVYGTTNGRGWDSTSPAPVIAGAAATIYSTSAQENLGGSSSSPTPVLFGVANQPPGAAMASFVDEGLATMTPLVSLFDGAPVPYWQDLVALDELVLAGTFPSASSFIGHALNVLYRSTNGGQDWSGVTTPWDEFLGNSPAGVPGDNPPALPLAIVTGVNDEFVFTSDELTGGDPDTFTIAAGVYATLGDLLTAVAAATDSDANVFGSWIRVQMLFEGDVGYLNFTELNTGAAYNGDTITEGNGGAAAIGYVSNPNTFGAGGSTNGLQVRSLVFGEGDEMVMGAGVQTAAAAYSFLGHSTDGGATWSDISDDSPLLDFYTYGASLAFDGSTWYLCAQTPQGGTCLWTSPDLVTWTPQTTGVDSEGLSFVVATSDVAIVASSETDTIGYSTDHGVTWTTISTGVGVALAGAVTDGAGNWLAWSAGGMVQSLDNASSWGAPVATPAFASSVAACFLPGTGWVTVWGSNGNNTPNYGGSIIYSAPVEDPLVITPTGYVADNIYAPVALVAV